MFFRKALLISSQKFYPKSLAVNNVNYFCTKKNKVKVEIPKNVLTHHTSHLQPEMGAVYDKKPFKIHLEQGKNYHWCLCGKSKTQPMCDGTHKDIYLRITLRPVRFAVAETKDYWLCNCKQTKNRPFCDGTHKSQAVQDVNTKV